MIKEITQKFWYEDVTQDIEKIIEAIDYYKAVYYHGQQYTTMKGTIAKLLEMQPGIVPLYEDTLTDAEMVGKWMEEEIKYIKAKKRIEFHRDPELKAEYGGDLKKTDIDNFIAADDEIRFHMQLLMMVELWVKDLHNLVERLNKRSMYLVMISKLRISGDHEAFIDTTHESKPDQI